MLIQWVRRTRNIKVNSIVVDFDDFNPTTVLNKLRNLKNNYGHNVDEVINYNKFYNALSKGQTSEVKALLESGADANYLVSGNLIDTPLSIGLLHQYGTPDNQDQDGIIKLLIEHGADVNKPSIESGIYPIMEAMDDLNTLKLLIDNGADINSIVVGFDGFNPTTVLKNLRNNYGHNVDEVINYIEGTGKFNYVKCDICDHEAIDIHDAYYFYYGDMKSRNWTDSGSNTFVTTKYEIVKEPKKLMICENCIQSKRKSKRITRLMLWIAAALMFALTFLSTEYNYILGTISLVYFMSLFGIKFDNSYEYIGDKMAIKTLKGDIKGHSFFFTRSEYNLMRRN